MRQKIYKKGRLFIVLPTIALLVLGLLFVIGCDEAGMVKPVVPVDGGTEPVEPPTEPTTNGDVKQPEEPSEPEPEPEPEPKPEPTVAIATAAQRDDGSVVVSGTSTDVPEGTTVTVTLGDTVTATSEIDDTGAWTVTVTAADAEALPAGTVTVTATAKAVSGTGSLVIPEPDPTIRYGISVPTEAEQITLETVVSVIGEDHPRIEPWYNYIQSKYGDLFDVETEVGQGLMRRFVIYEEKRGDLASNPPDSIEEEWEILDQLFEEAYGISAEYSEWLIYNIYLDEKPEDKHFLGTGWQTESIGMEYLLLQTANPDATEEELLELLRESIRAGKVTIASQR